MNGVVCYWRWVEKPRGGDMRQGAGQWEFVEAFGVDQDGYPLTQPKNTDSDKQCWYHWMHKKSDADDPEMGHAVTYWCMTDGVSLLDFNPPGDWQGWLSIGFYEKVCKGKRWLDCLEDSGTLYFGTVKHAEGIIHADHQKSTGG